MECNSKYLCIFRISLQNYYIYFTYANIWAKNSNFLYNTAIELKFE